MEPLFAASQGTHARSRKASGGAWCARGEQDPHHPRRAARVWHWHLFCCDFITLPPGTPTPGAVLWLSLFKSEKCSWTSRVRSYPKADKFSTRKSQVSNHRFSLKKKKKKKKIFFPSKEENLISDAFSHCEFCLMLLANPLLGRGMR